MNYIDLMNVCIQPRKNIRGGSLKTKKRSKERFSEFNLGKF